MTDQVYKNTLEAAEAELEALLAEEATLEARLAMTRVRAESLRRTVLSLGDLVGDQREPLTVGITDAIRKVLREAKTPDGAIGYRSPISVRNALEREGFPLADYKNALAVIHTTLRRLEDQHEVESHTNSANGKVYYKIAETGITDDDIPF